ncbi:MAG: hydantoinase B/oxoprolinase family protein [Actinobacteria bacterium]|nr:hydantoinase B/oxoprolinase family protein [Actinomycetota bacterium]
MTEPVDAVTFEVVHAGLRAVAQEMKTAVQRTAYSPIVSTGGDMSVGIGGPDGRVVAQGRDIPAQLGALPFSFEAMLRDRAGTLGPGDVLIGNDPYVSGSNHINDVCLIMPAFTDDETLLGYVCTRTHWMDIGGSAPGSFNVRVADMYAEGLRIPTLLAYRGYEPVADIWELIFSNVRGRTEREWDLRAGYAGCVAGERGLQRLARRYGSGTVLEVSDRAIEYTERRMRARIEEVPDGEYNAFDWLEGDGWEDRPVRIEVTMRVRGSDVEFDWSGSAPQVRGGLNLGFPSTAGVSVYALKAALDPDIPPNAGMWAPVTVTAPEATVVNPSPPAPNQAGVAETIQRMADLLMLCLAEAVPDDVIAGTFASATVMMIEGRDPLAWRREALRRDRMILMDNSPGGMGARATRDGVSGIKVHTGNARVQPVEMVEFNAPVRYVRWERVPDTGGAGRQRGGTSVAREWQVVDDVNLTLLTERAHIPAFGLFGGSAGACGVYAINVGSPEEQRLPSKTPPQPLARGDRFVLQSAGGGGYGPAWERPIDEVVDDYLDGYVTRDGARAGYGVVIGADGAVDEAATAELRAQMADGAAARGGTVDRGTWSYEDISWPPADGG